MAESSDTGATRSRFLELREEQRLVRDGYEFLDEKRILLAAELLSQLAQFQERYRRYEALHAEAVDALRLAVRRHGLDELTVYPRGVPQDLGLDVSSTRFLGVVLTRATLAFEAERRTAANPSPEARHCGARFGALVEMAAELAALRGNLHRLSAEYVRTDRRARALDNVLLPEIADALKAMEDQLEVIEQEDAVRVRLHAPA